MHARAARHCQVRWTITLDSDCRLQEALADFEQALTIEPKNGLSHNARGLLLEKMGRPDAALADFERAVQLDGANVDFLRNRGLCFRARREYNKAVEDFDRYAQRPAEALPLWQPTTELTDSQTHFAVMCLQHVLCSLVIIRHSKCRSTVPSEHVVPACTVLQAPVKCDAAGHDVAGYCSAVQQI